MNYIELLGFRSFGMEAQRLDLTSSLAVVHAGNSQGKTSLCEGFEFLLTGETTRRFLLGGAPSEFESSLRNAHIRAGEPVYVEAGFEDDAGNTWVLRRTLTSDYRGASGCDSELTLNGNAIASPTEMGFPLADPPLRAPVLFQHNLRYALAAKPTDRTDYFKTLLDVGDLEIIRRIVSSLVAEREQAPRDPILADLGRVAAVQLFSVDIAVLRTARTSEEVESGLLAALHSALRAAHAADPLPGTLHAAAEVVTQVLAERQAGVLPVGDFTMTGLMPTLQTEPLATKLNNALTAFTERASVVDERTAQVIPLLRAALTLPDLAQGDAIHPQDCPLCGAAGTITPERIVAVRAQVASQEELSTSATNTRTALRALVEIVNQLGRAATSCVPNCHRWTDDERTRWSSAAKELGAPTSWLETVLILAGSIHGTVESIRAATQGSADAIRDIDAYVEVLRIPPQQKIDEATANLADLEKLGRELQGAIQTYRDSLAGVPELLREAVEQRTDTEGWQTLLGLANRAPAVLAALQAFDRRSAATERLRRADRDLDRAVQAVLDAKFQEMGGEIGRWWDTLRPGELVQFREILRRGTGRRFLDITATLRPNHTSTGEIRNAISVFSDSQLNALGLAAFLARCHLHNSPLIVLDDPVPGSDHDHQHTFATSTIDKLLNDGHQLVIATFDRALVQLIETRHRHRGVDIFEAILEDGVAGTLVTRAEDDFERLLAAAQSQMRSPHIENRRAAGNNLRIAAERLAKLIVIADRKSRGQSASLAGFANKNLRELRPLVAACSVAPDEPGLWEVVARVLNDADHDTTNPPTNFELVDCHGQLKRLKREHSRHSPGLMTP